MLNLKYERDFKKELCDLVRSFCSPKINNYKEKQLSSNLTDIDFVAVLSSKREYKGICPICLSPEMGSCAKCIEAKNDIDTSCGNKEIGILNPCGHAMCMHCVKTGRFTKCPICRQAITKIIDDSKIDTKNIYDEISKFVDDYFEHIYK